MSEQSPLERLLQEEAQRRLLWWLLGSGIGIPVLIVLVVLVLIVGLTAWLGGGVYGYHTYLGSAQVRPATWLNVIQQAGTTFPNVVELADMQHESQGQVSTTNYNCSNGQSSDNAPCSLAFGQGVKTTSADAGLMQINSGVGQWPATPKWDTVFGSGKSPYSPIPNIREGIKELNADVLNCGGYLEYGLSAYNTGSCQSPKGFQYASQVLTEIQGFTGPTASAWATGNYVGAHQQHCLFGYWGCWGPTQHYWRQPYPNAKTWVMASGFYALPTPPNTPVTVLWAPPPTSCKKNCQPIKYPFSPVYLPNRVTINGQEATLYDLQPGQQSPPHAPPIMPGQAVWGLKTSDTGTINVKAEWEWTLCSKRGCTTFRQYATSTITVLPAKGA